MLKWKILPEFDRNDGIHTRFQIRMLGDVFQLKLEDNETWSILKKDKLSENFFPIKEGLLGIKPAKKYFAHYIL